MRSYSEKGGPMTFCRSSMGACSRRPSASCTYRHLWQQRGRTRLTPSSDEGAHWFPRRSCPSVLRARSVSRVRPVRRCCFDHPRRNQPLDGPNLISSARRCSSFSSSRRLPVRPSLGAGRSPSFGNHRRSLDSEWERWTVTGSSSTSESTPRQTCDCQTHRSVRRSNRSSWLHANSWRCSAPRPALSATCTN